MSKFSGQNDFCDFIENYGGFNKFLQDTGGKFYHGKDRVNFSNPLDLVEYYPHQIANVWKEEDILIVKILKKSYLDNMFSEASKEYFKWKVEEEKKKIGTKNE